MSNLARQHLTKFFYNKLFFNNNKKYGISYNNFKYGANHVYRLQPTRFFHRSAELNKLVSFHLSDIGEGIKEVVVKEWFIQEGDHVEQFQNICEVQSDKASVTITSRYEGKITKRYHKVDDIALVGKPLVDIDVVEEDEEESSSSSSSSSSSESDNEVTPVETKKKSPKTSENLERMEEIYSDRKKVLATPAVRRIAYENHVDLTKVKATGKQQRVLKEDILNYLSGSVAPQAPPSAAKLTKPSIAPVEKLQADRVEPLKGIRKVMFKSMTESLRIPHFGYKEEITITNLVKFRDEIKVEAAALGTKLTFMPFFIKAASLALEKYPILNSSLDETTESIIYKGSHNISIAINTPDGLVVPNIKNCQEKTIMHIANDLNALQHRGLHGKLSPDDYANGTFALSNIGNIGGTYTHPLLMVPQVCIGALGKAKIVPQFNENGEIIPVHIVNVSWSCDHRVIDGATIANFTTLWKKYLENPSLFILHM